MDNRRWEEMTELPGANSGIAGVIRVVDYVGYHADDADEDRRYDNEKFLVSLQGLLNREGPCLYVRNQNPKDKTLDYWVYLRSREDGLLYGYKAEELGDRAALLDTYADELRQRGVVVWDPEVPATSNLAATVCGVEGYLPVMYSEAEDSLYHVLTTRYAVPVKCDLCGRFTGTGTVWETDIPSTGTAKLDAYTWALEKYLAPGKCSREYMAYMVDYFPISRFSTRKKWLNDSIYETYLPDQDFLVMKKAFFVDLGMLRDEVAGDDPTQEPGADYRMLCRILKTQYDLNNGAFSQCVGFAPFVYKYCSASPFGGKYDAVMAEWTLVEVMSAYNIALQADCPGPSSIHNCSVYTHGSIPQGYSQANKRPDVLPEFDPTKKYISIYCGDYDAASWTAAIGAKFWQDGGRGEVPLAWGFNPNLVERIPHVFAYFMETATDKDLFVAGDSGAGYVNANLLCEGKRKHSDLPEGLTAWAEWCRRWYARLDITISAFLLDGNNGYANEQVREVYADFSPDGIGVWNWPGKFSGFSLSKGVPVTGMPQDVRLDQCADAETNAQQLVKIVSEQRAMPFYQIKSVIVPPQLAVDSVRRARELDPAIVPLDMFTFYAMIRQQLEIRNTTL